MNSPRDPQITEILLAMQAGEVDRPAATGRVFEAAYQELRRIAGGLMVRERPNHTLQPTALIHEAYGRLADDSRLEWGNRAHFFGIAVRAMRQVLVEHARKKNAQKRGGDLVRVTFDDRIAEQTNDVDMLALERALVKLAGESDRMLRVVELRFFGGLKTDEIAHVLAISPRTVQEDWRMAKMWLARELGG